MLCKINKNDIILNTEDKDKKISQNFHIHLLTEEHFKEFMDIVNSLIDEPIIIPNHFVLEYAGKNALKKIKEDDDIFEELQGYIHNDTFLKVRKFCINCREELVLKIFEKTGIFKHSIKYIHYPHIHTQSTDTYKPIKNITGAYKNKYPIYILSKGRYFRERKYQAPKTIQCLERMGIKDYKVIVEEDEYENYNKSIHQDNLIILDRTKIDTEGDGGGIPARNFIHYLNKDSGLDAYWILDDNIDQYTFTNYSQRIRCLTPLPFVAVEDIFDESTNVMLAGHQYVSFIPSNDRTIKVKLNYRVYSSILINNKIPTLSNGNIWRGIYNEDIELSIRMLKAGYGTFCHFTFLAKKECTNGGVKGGNHTDIYEVDKHTGILKTEALIDLHSDVVKSKQSDWWINKKKKELGKRMTHDVDYVKLFEKYGKPKININQVYNYDIKYNY